MSKTYWLKPCITNDTTEYWVDPPQDFQACNSNSAIECYLTGLSHFTVVAHEV